jgi:hypothetical protein
MKTISNTIIKTGMFWLVMKILKQVEQNLVSM